ncbi:tetratricopeptide repeat protein 14-like [Tautogolabrus adspersus]
MPPLELFMEASFEERRIMLYRDLEKGDIVVGRINNIREYGFFLTLLCTAGGLKRDIEDLELSPKNLTPLLYSRSICAAADSSETYECILQSCHGYHNPSVVDYLLEKVGISDNHPPSMMRGLQSKLFQEEDFASVIRKKQSASWALKCVRAGVDHFKHGRHVEAMNEYNKALDIDTNNGEALVARGALRAACSASYHKRIPFIMPLKRCWKKKRKRSASSSSSSSNSSQNSSSSSTSSNRRRSKKKKKKRRRTERGSKRHSRISSRESRRSEEGKSERDRKEKEEDEVEWYPAPPNTSATFLNQKGGPGFGEEEVEEKDAEDRTLSAASDDEESDSSRKERKRSLLT